MKLSVPSCSPTLPLYLGLPTEQTESQGTPLGRVALVSVEIHTEIQTTPVSAEVQAILYSIWPHYCDFNRNSIEIKETRATKTKGKIQDEKEDEMEDRRQR